MAEQQLRLNIQKYTQKITKYAQRNPTKAEKYRKKLAKATRELRELSSDSSSDSLSESRWVESDHDSDDGAAAAQEELEDRDAAINVQKEVWFTDNSRATVYFNYEADGQWFWTWSKREHIDGYYSIVPPAHGESDFTLHLEQETLYLPIDREKTDHQTLKDLGVYVKGSGAAPRPGHDATDLVSAKFSKLYLK